MKKSIIFLLVILCVSGCVEAQDKKLFEGKYKKALFIGAHPDDNESCAGGTMIRLQQQGCDVVSVYLTSGEAGIKGKSHEEAAAIRREELKAACKVMGVRYRWMTQIDGSTEITQERYQEMLKVIEEEKPDVVFTHWPIDGHRDHRICSMLVFDVWRKKGDFDLYYYEAETGHQTRNFSPELYVDITAVADKKHEALNCHKSQNPEVIMGDWHNDMELFRGKESECNRAEAFIMQRSYK